MNIQEKKKINKIKILMNSRLNNLQMKIQKYWKTIKRLIKKIKKIYLMKIAYSTNKKEQIHLNFY